MSFKETRIELPDKFYQCVLDKLLQPSHVSANAIHTNGDYIITDIGRIWMVTKTYGHSLSDTKVNHYHTGIKLAIQNNMPYYKWNGNKGIFTIPTTILVIPQYIDDDILQRVWILQQCSHIEKL